MTRVKQHTLALLLGWVSGMLDIVDNPVHATVAGSMGLEMIHHLHWALVCRNRSLIALHKLLPRKSKGDVEKCNEMGINHFYNFVEEAGFYGDVEKVIGCFTKVTFSTVWVYSADGKLMTFNLFFLEKRL